MPNSLLFWSHKIMQWEGLNLSEVFLPSLPMSVTFVFLLKSLALRDCNGPSCRQYCTHALPKCLLNSIHPKSHLHLKDGMFLSVSVHSNFGFPNYRKKFLIVYYNLCNGRTLLYLNPQISKTQYVYTLCLLAKMINGLETLWWNYTTHEMLLKIWPLPQTRHN